MAWKFHSVTSDVQQNQKEGIQICIPWKQEEQILDILIDQFTLPSIILHFLLSPTPCKLIPYVVLTCFHCRNYTFEISYTPVECQTANYNFQVCENVDYPTTLTDPQLIETIEEELFDEFYVYGGGCIRVMKAISCAYFFPRSARSTLRVC